MDTERVLQRGVLDELEREANLDAAHVGVTVEGGIVTLHGHVQTNLDRYLAEEAAKRVHGVKAVANELEVRLPGSLRTDEDIAAEVIGALEASGLVPTDRILITVGNGWVKLDGEVEWAHQKEAAARAVQQVPGVTGVTNRIKVAPRVPPPDARSKI